MEQNLKQRLKKEADYFLKAYESNLKKAEEAFKKGNEVESRISSEEAAFDYGKVSAYEKAIELITEYIG